MAAAKDKPKDPANAARLADPRRKAVRIRAGVLHGALKEVASIAPGRSEAIPILNHVLIEVVEGSLSATVGNLDMWAQRSCATDDADQGKEWLEAIRPFALTLPAKALLAILAELEPEQAVVLELPADSTQAALTAGRASFKLNSLPAEDFPVPPPFEGRHAIELTCSALADAFHAVEHAISTEETRYYLNGIYLHVSPGADGEAASLRFAAADGHRLARLRIEPPEGADDFPGMIVMRESIGLLDRLLATAMKTSGADDPARVLVEVAGAHSGALTRWLLPAADGGDVVVTAKTVDGTFPDYTRVIPGDPPHSAVIGRAALATAVKRVGVIADAKSRMVRAEFDTDRLTLSVTTPELGTAREELPCLYDGPAVSMGLNGQYWREALAAPATDEVAMGLPGEGTIPVTAPVLLTAVGADTDRQRLVQVLMPMRGA